MLKISLKQKFLLFFCSVIVILFMIEISLRATGMMQLTLRDWKNQTKLKSLGSYRVLCIGESTTYLDGDNNYPNYLSQILNSSGLKKNFTVINKGTPGISTDYVVKKIPSWIDEYKPDIVLVMMGANDEILIPWDDNDSPVLAFLKNTQLYKLECQLSSALRNYKNEHFLSRKNGSSIGAVATAGNLRTIRDQFFNRIKKKDPDFRNLYKTAVILEGTPDFGFLEHIYKDLLSRTSDPILHAWLYKKLGEILKRLNRFSEFVDLMPLISRDYWGSDWIGKVCTDDAGTEHVKSVLQPMIARRKNKAPYYKLLAKCYDQSGRTTEAETLRQKAKNALLKTIHPATQKNYLTLARILAPHNITTVYVQYPLRSVDPLKKILKPALNSNRMLFVDNEAVFKNAIQEASFQDYFIDAFAGDFGHCSQKGNELLAQNIASVLIKHIKK